MHCAAQITSAVFYAASTLLGILMHLLKSKSSRLINLDVNREQKDANVGSRSLMASLPVALHYVAFSYNMRSL
ncbi:hypothetical protein GGX14DRAFT_463807 [Mycena pura]|uniref:Uncharacterized protein n=1 Tax=Mycena pura TaxID=153505 RepID=A0AAD6Y8G5_9AGAR|nr:hypothetical protein GGX14DRAFT_463807 [Mycena pura]